MGPGGAAGPIGVTVFFVLSGYLITGTIVTDLEAFGRVRWRRFAVRRAARLFPALCVMLGCVWAVLLGLGLANAQLLRDTLWVLGYQYNWTRLDGSDSPLFSHMWSLSVEEQFYIVWPGLLMVAWRRWGATGAGWACLVGAGALMGWREVVNSIGFDEWAKYGTDTSAAGLLLGAAIVCLKPRLPALLGWAGMALVLVPALASAQWEVQGRSVAAVGTACVITAPPSVLSWRPLRGLGIISYGVYLWHYPLQRFMAELGMPAIPFAGHTCRHRVISLAGAANP